MIIKTRYNPPIIKIAYLAKYKDEMTIIFTMGMRKTTAVAMAIKAPMYTAILPNSFIESICIKKNPIPAHIPLIRRPCPKTSKGMNPSISSSALILNQSR